jgi:hypothetical protein
MEGRHHDAGTDTEPRLPAGNAIDFLLRIHGATFHEAMQQLTRPQPS